MRRNLALVVLVLVAACGRSAAIARTDAPPVSPEAAFWAWFAASSDRLFDFDKDRSAVFADVSAHLKPVDVGLIFEFGPVREGRREFVISADGIQKAFPAVRRLAAAAPPLARWTITAFRPRHGAYVIEMQGRTLDPKDVKFVSRPEAGMVGLVVFLPGLTAESHDLLARMAFILLDSVLGEYDTETKVGSIAWKDAREAPADAQPLSALAAVVDQLPAR